MSDPYYLMKINIIKTCYRRYLVEIGKVFSINICYSQTYHVMVVLFPNTKKDRTWILVFNIDNYLLITASVAKIKYLTPFHERLGQYLPKTTV